ncbi:acyltransferase family protein [Mucilaginibacter angelicae]|uniref:Acyltransferase family protein n=1 Tax=Mucilaginibacter angelicae TaxID=869718 RepID=A0ABV6L4R3_9SPHI
MPAQRILIIDGFRFIALIGVVLYHLTNPYVVHYPHAGFVVQIFSFGYLGVNFFFMISGFVINYTLENTSNISSFFKNRFIRLFPAMLLCSLLTFLTAPLLDKVHHFPGAHEAINLLPGLTFAHPALWSEALGRPIQWINGSYWTLWVELQFYVLAAVVYFINKRNFLRNFVLAAILVSIFKEVPNYLGHNHPGIFFSNWRRISEIFNLTFNIGWFCFGVFFFQLFKGTRFGFRNLSTYGFVVILICQVTDTLAYYSNSTVLLLGIPVMSILFLLMIYKKTMLTMLENKLLTHIGKISYSIYLIHEVIGISLINSYGSYLGSLNSLSPFLVTLLFIGFATISYRYYERRVSTWLK